MTGITRNLTLKIRQALDMFPVVILLGARQTGKTTWQNHQLQTTGNFKAIYPKV